MRDYEKLRKALGDLLQHGGMGGEVAAAVCDQAVKVLADTPETSEMEGLDKEWIRQQIRSIDPESAWDTDEVTDAIAQAAEEEITGFLSEVKALREERDLAWERADALEAQVAAMASALQHIGRVGCFALNDQRGLTKLETEDIQEEVDEALSAAPKVLTRCTGAIYRAGDGAPWLDLTGLDEKFVNGTVYDVLVLAHDQGQERPRCPDQGQDSEQEES